MLCKINSNTGLQYLRARYYNPANGNFITQDTYEGELTSPISQNRYTYANNDPINMIDPTGHWPHGEFLPKYIRDFVELKPKPVYNLPSLEEIRSRALAPLERIQQRNSGGSGGGINPQPPKTQAQLYFEKVKAEFFKKFCEDGSKQVKKDEGIDWNRVNKGAIGTLKVINGVLKAGGGAALFPVTAGLSYGIMAMGSNQMSECIGDLISAFTNPKQKSYNPIRDTLLMGNQTAYDILDMSSDVFMAGGAVKSSTNVLRGTSKIAASEATKLMQNTFRANLPVPGLLTSSKKSNLISLSDTEAKATCGGSADPNWRPSVSESEVSRRAAFRQAKRDAGVPMSQQPEKY